MIKFKLKGLLCGFSALLPVLAQTVLAHAGTRENKPAQVPAIMYHSLLNKDTTQWNISPDAFEADLKYLSENGYQTVFISDLIAYVYDGVPLPEKAILLTFDDGYYNNYKNGLPLLEKYNMKIVMSVLGENSDHWTGRSGENDEHHGYMTWTQVSEMVESGRVELANHTQNLHKNTDGRDGCCRKKSEDVHAYEQMLTKDVETLQGKLEKISGVRPECFTYPFGSICKESVELIRKLGFKASLSCESGINSIQIGDSECLVNMKRNNRAPNQPLESILKNLE